MHIIIFLLCSRRIEGSSAGIGKETALLMAARGAKLTLHGRRSDKLNEVADQVESISGFKVLNED